MAKLRIQFDQERIIDEVTVDEYIALEQNDFSAIKSVCGKFVLKDDGTYYPPEEGMAIIGSQPLRTLMDLRNYLVDKAQDGAVPLPNDEA